MRLVGLVVAVSTGGVLFAAAPAGAAGYAAIDALEAQRQGLPEGTIRMIAAQVPAATGEEKACLLTAGIDATIVSVMPGSPPVTAVDQSRCAALGLDASSADAKLAQRRADQAARRKTAVETEEAERQAALARPVCRVVSGKDTSSVQDAAEQIEEWMAVQVAAGRTQFMAVPYTSTVMVSGNGGGSTTAVVCAWRP